MCRSYFCSTIPLVAGLLLKELNFSNGTCGGVFNTTSQFTLPKEYAKTITGFGLLIEHWEGLPANAEPPNFELREGDLRIALYLRSPVHLSHASYPRCPRKSIKKAAYSKAGKQGLLQGSVSSPLHNPLLCPATRHWLDVDMNVQAHGRHSSPTVFVRVHRVGMWCGGRRSTG